MFGSNNNLQKEDLSILNVLPDIIYKIDKDGKFVYISDSVTQLGYKPEDLLGKHFSIILHPDDVPRVSRDKVLPGLEGKVTGDDRAPKLMDERRRGGRGTHNLVVRLKSSDKKSDSRSYPQMYGEIMASGHYQDGEDQNAMQFDGTVGKISPIPDLQKAIDKVWSAAKIFIKFSGVKNKKIEQDKLDKNLIGTVGIIRDVSERVRLEEQLNHSKKMEAVGELAGGITHDFNNLLGIVSGHSELINLKFLKENPGIKKYTDVIASAVKDASELTSKLLAFARRGKYSNEPVNIHELISDTLQMLERTFNRNIKISSELGAENSHIMGDENQLKNVIINLAINARDAMPDGGKLRFKLTNLPFEKVPFEKSSAEESNQQYLCLSVKDTGTGMDEETKEHLFEPFFTTKNSGKGRGLGLASVYGIVERHEGVIKVKSKPGKGTTFNLYFPITSPSEKKQSEVQPILTTPKLESRRFLILDDEKRAILAHEELLESSGHKVKSFTNSKRALTWYKKHFHDVDVVLLDIMMPGMSGTECYREMKKYKPGQPTIFMTGYSLESATQIVVKDPNVRFLQKPLSQGKLMETIRKILA